ncbi:MAG: acyl-protein synthetase [gamma proteobacterium symbiont of Taylorina sp.]|nr:acyl-protein synthetase [gamma proteobacterium symbiont of Taylorina sp.]
MSKFVIDPFYKLPVYGIAQEEKECLLNDALNQLNNHHYKYCQNYNNLIDSIGFSLTVDTYVEQPYVMARLFKILELKSVVAKEIFKQLNSSGTSSQVVSKIFLNAQAAKVQSKVLAKILLDLFERKQLGKQRLPMLFIEAPDIIKNRNSFSARGAGIQGLSFLGRNHTYALNNDMTLNHKAIDGFIEQFQYEPVLIFGFTFMIWKYFIEVLKKKNKNYSFEQGLLLHSGGWKKLQAIAVDNQEFKHQVKLALGNVSVHNFYGMVEQTGTISIECEAGYLHPPVFSDILIRDPLTLKVKKTGEEGLIQLFSILPESYPGQSLLTEDMGQVIGRDDCVCGRKGQYFKVVGRLAQAENRGCSDTFSE